MTRPTKNPIPIRYSYAEKMAHAKGYRADLDGCVSSSFRRLFPWKDTRGYLRFAFREEGKRIQCSVHRLVAYQKFGEKIYEGQTQVRHLDGDRMNNAFANIEIGTPHDNAMDMTEAARRQRSKTGTSKLRSVTEEQVRWIRRQVECGVSYAEIQEKFGIAKSTVSYIVNGKTYAATEGEEL